MRTRRIIHNARNGISCTIVAGYYKFGLETLIGWTYGSTGTCIIEVHEDPSGKNEYGYDNRKQNFESVYPLRQGIAVGSILQEE